MRFDWRFMLAVAAAALLYTGCDAGGSSGAGTSADTLDQGTDTAVNSDTSGGLTPDAGPNLPTPDATSPVDNDAGNVGVDAGTGTPSSDGGITNPADGGPTHSGCVGNSVTKGGGGAFQAQNEIAVIEQQPGSPSKFLIYQAHSSTQPPLDLLSIEINAGMMPSLNTPHSLEGLANANLSQGVPIVVAAAVGCTNQGCSKVLFANEGTITFSELSETGKIVASLESVTLVEVQIDQQTGQSSVVPGGETWYMECWNIDMPFQAPAEVPTGGPAQANCVAEGTGVYQGDNVANLTMQNCAGEMVELHATCGQSKAHWFLATAGWCSACEQMIAQLTQQFGGANGVMSRASIAAAQPGLDMWILLGENQNSAKPSMAYCQSYAQQRNIDPSMIFIDYTDAETQVPLIEPSGYAIPVNALGNVWSVMNPYLTADGSGAVQMGFPWNGILNGANMEYVWSDYMGGDINQVLGNLLSQ